MDAGQPPHQHAGRDAETDADSLARLTARVAELERLVGELTVRRVQAGATPLPAAPYLDESGTGVAPPPQLAAMQDYPTRHVPHRSLEDRLGAQVFNLIGIVALIAGASWFFKLAVEHGWIGPVARVLLGLAAGAGLVVWSERFRSRGYAAFSYSLKAVGTTVLYLVLWAAYQMYALLPEWAALGAMMLVTAWNGYMAWSQQAELVAAYALAGGLATPLLLSTGGNHETFLFSYLAALDAAVVALLRRRPWPRLLLPALLGTAGYFFGWFLHFFHAAAGPAGAWETIGFASVFWVLFAVVSMRGWQYEADEGIIPSMLLPLGNAAFLAGALAAVLEDRGHHDWLAWLMLVLAAVYLGLLRLQATRLSRAIHLGLAVVFLTVAIPLKAHGHGLTAAWLVEGAVLYWVSTRVARETPAAVHVLHGLSAAAFVLGLGSLVLHWTFTGWGFSVQQQERFFSANLGLAAVALGALGAVFRFSRSGSVHSSAHSVSSSSLDTSERYVTGSACLLAGVPVALLVAERDLDGGRTRAAFWNAGFANALLALAILAGIAWLAAREAGKRRWLSLGGVQIVFHLIAILAVEREIGALFLATAGDTTAELERSLAISGFLMLYASALLAAGFWRRSASVRWQGLALLLFTVGKVFLFDTGGLSQGYRVVSFLALGAVLMAVSFAYQRDWLGLKQTRSES